DGIMHPRQGDGHHQEQEHEAALPYADDVIQHAEGQWEQKTTQTTDHADDPTDRADMAGIIGRDMLENGRLAQRHEEAEYDGQQYEHGQTHAETEADVAANT